MGRLRRHADSQLVLLGEKIGHPLVDLDEQIGPGTRHVLVPQFENHLRAILDLSLGSTAACGHSAMVNLIGAIPPLPALLALDPALHVHIYGKSAREGRKLGHCTIVDRSATGRERRLRRLLPRLAPGVRIA